MAAWIALSLFVVLVSLAFSHHHHIAAAFSPTQSFSTFSRHFVSWNFQERTKNHPLFYRHSSIKEDGLRERAPRKLATSILPLEISNVPEEPLVYPLGRAVPKNNNLKINPLVQLPKHQEFKLPTQEEKRPNKVVPRKQTNKKRNKKRNMDKKKLEQKRESGINRLMMRHLVLSQATLLSLATAVALLATTFLGKGHFWDALQWMHPNVLDASFSTSAWSRLLLGFLGAIPMILVSQRIDQAESRRDTSHVHFATTNMVLNLFGKRRRRKFSFSTNTDDKSVDNVLSPVSSTTSTLQMIWSSMGLATLTSLTEEVVFRGYVPCLILALTHSIGAAWLGQALIFGLCHLHSEAQMGENRVVVATQMFNGLFGYGLIYAISGDLWSCMIAHVFYDMHVLVSSWHSVNTQMDWTEDSMLQTTKSSSNKKNPGTGDNLSLQQLQQWAGPSLTAETLNLCRRFFYAFDEDHKHALSLPNVQRAMSYAFLKDPKQPSTLQVERLFHRVLRERQNPQEASLYGTTSHKWEDRINLAEFVRLLFSLRAQTLKPAASGTV